VIEHRVQDYPGLASHPFTWEESVEKFDGLVACRVDAGLGREIKAAVLSLESIQVRDLVNLLSFARAPSRGTDDVGRHLSRKETA
jgi:2-methylcitrate dehydratase